jgi:tRNA 2-selenouridine synthase
VLPGGWINYRRWVEAGLEVLPRMLDFRALSAADPTDVGHVLTGLAELGCSVLSLDQLAATVRAGRGKVQQHRFESELLNVLRWLDPARPVWVSNSQTDLCNARIPLALVQAIDTAPLVSIRTGKASELELDKAGGLSMPPLALYDRTPLSIRDAVAQWLNLLPT